MDFVAVISFEHVCQENEKHMGGLEFVKLYLNQHQEITITTAW